MSQPVVEMRDIYKSFPGVNALENVSLILYPGEIHALVGENGAGKSTLIKILAGAYHSDRGEILFNGEKIVINNPSQGLKFGIGAIYQEFNLVPELSIAANIVLGNEPSLGVGRLDARSMHQIAKQALDQLGLDIDTAVKVRDLRVAQQQIVEIAKALVRDLKIIIMDEPTAALNNNEIDKLFEVLEKLKARGISILYISHRLREIFQIADRLTVLKDGKLVGTKTISEVDERQIVSMMVGRELSNIYPPKNSRASDLILSVNNLSLNKQLRNVSFNLHRGEILGIAGLEGQGQSELARVLVGDIKQDKGTINNASGELIQLKSPQSAQKNGIGYVPDDRKGQGLVLIRSVKENISLPTLHKRKKNMFIDRGAEGRFVTELIEMLSIKVSTDAQITRNLSGGNQQKVVIAKCLGAEPEVLIVSEPTRGIDVGSKSEIHHIMRDLANKGVGIIMISSELPEILGMSDRVLVISQGEIVQEIPGDVATEEMIMAAATRTNIGEGE